MTAHASIPGQARPNSYAQQASKVSHAIYAHGSDKGSVWGMFMWGHHAMLALGKADTRFGQEVQPMQYAKQIVLSNFAGLCCCLDVWQA